MALGSLPSLTEINTEIGTSGQRLTMCIANAGKTGIWDRQSDFAGYTHVDSISVSPPTVTVSWSQLATTATITSSGQWEVVTSYPAWITDVTSPGSTGSDSTITLSQNGTGSNRVGTVTYRLVSNTGVTDTIVVTQTPA